MAQCVPVYASYVLHVCVYSMCVLCIIMLVVCLRMYVRICVCLLYVFYATYVQYVHVCVLHVHLHGVIGPNVLPSLQGHS